MKETIIMQFQTVLNEVIFRQTFFFFILLNMMFLSKSTIKIEFESTTLQILKFVFFGGRGGGGGGLNFRYVRLQNTCAKVFLCTCINV